MSQESEVLAWLEGGRTLTAAEAYRRFGTLRLAARVADLRAKGKPIRTRYKSVQVKTGGTAKVAVYYMEERNEHQQSYD